MISSSILSMSPFNCFFLLLDPLHYFFPSFSFLLCSFTYSTQLYNFLIFCLHLFFFSFLVLLFFLIFISMFLTVYFAPLFCSTLVGDVLYGLSCHAVLRLAFAILLSLENHQSFLYFVISSYTSFYILVIKLVYMSPHQRMTLLQILDYHLFSWVF